MMLPGSNRRIHSVHRHSGMDVAGLAADGRQIVARAKSEAHNYESTYGEPIPIKELADRVASYVHLCTLYWWLRPFGSGVILGGYDCDGPQLYMVEPSGVSYVTMILYVAGSKSNDQSASLKPHITGNIAGSNITIRDQSVQLVLEKERAAKESLNCVKHLEKDREEEREQSRVEREKERAEREKLQKRKDGRGTPFVSAIELRLLESNMYPQTDFGSLYVYKYADFGNAGELRYKPDSYDRLWSPATLPNTSPLYTSNKISPGRSTITLPPSRVMSTAITPTSPTDTLSITWNKRNASDEFLVYLHFAEIEMLNRTQNREFNIYLNGNITYGPFSPLNHTTTTFYYSTKPENNAHTYTLTISKTENSTLPPIVNALELYTLKQLPQRQTYDQDASAMWSIKSSYKLTMNWQGDPCTPQKFVWDGLRCGSDDQDFPRVTFLNLSNSGLSGEIDSRLANLTKIDTLDLSNNNLTGTVPNFLSELNFLKVLNLKGNNFIGPVPEELIAKSDQGSLLLSFDDENARDAASYCDGNACENKKNKRFIVPIIATVAFICLIFIVSVAIWMFKKQKAHGSGLRIRKQQYTYSEVQTITNNFNVVIGKGGFGTVYHGRIGNTQVAVKMLSESSDQGEKQFQAEANLLQSVHHKNLTSFVGYCNEEKHKGIIYEYMANGNLEKHLFDTSLDWEQRLQIGCDAAHGLEYLHHGCKPPIVHRDIKCTNILLNGTFQAKLADFGLSRAFPTDSDTHISTIVAGTPGYLDPEYHITSRLTEKNDIYSFGVVLLVIITGQPAVTRYENDNIHISQWVSLKLSEGDMKTIVDPKVGDFDINSAWRAVEVAMACVVDTPNSRPTMNKVVMELKDCLVIERARKETESSNLTEFVSLNLESVYDPNSR